jgi:hypothetical protein
MFCFLYSISLAVLLFFTVLMVFEELPDAFKLGRQLRNATPQHDKDYPPKKGGDLVARLVLSSLWRRIVRAKFDILVLFLDAVAVTYRAQLLPRCRQ